MAGFEVVLTQAPSDAALPEADIYCLGGGEDGPQVRARAFVHRGRHVGPRVPPPVPSSWPSAPATRSSGRPFPAQTATLHEGVGLLDIATAKGTDRVPWARSWGSRATTPRVRCRR